jgi:hypothetical protein
MGVADCICEPDIQHSQAPTASRPSRSLRRGSSLLQSGHHSEENRPLMQYVRALAQEARRTAEKL